MNLDIRPCFELYFDSFGIDWYGMYQSKHIADSLIKIQLY